MAGKGLFRRMLGLCGILLAGIAVGFALLTAVFLLPVDAMEEHVLASIPALSGEWGTGEESYEQVLKGYASTQLDNSTDAYMLLSAIHRSDKSAVDQAVNVYTWQDPDSFGQYGTLLRYGKSGSEGMQEKATARYWLGYLVVLKPLLLFLNYMDIRMLNMIVQLGLVMLLCCLMQKRGLGRYVLPFGLSLLCITPGVTWLSLQFSTTLLVALAAMAALLWKPQRMKTPMAEDVFFLLTGMATSYFDFLTYPIATLGLPLAARMALRQKQEKPCGLADFVKICLSWGIGYAGMWSGKWLMAALLTGQNVFAEAGSAMGNRLGAVDDSGVELALTTGVQENLRIMFNPLTVLMLLGVLAVCALLWLRVGGRPDVKRLGTYLLCALLPIAWYMALLNHSAEHAFFTYRALCVTIFAAVSMAIPTGKAET